MTNTQYRQIQKTIKVLIETRRALADTQLKLDYGTEPREDLNQILGSLDWSYTNLSSL